MKTHFKVRFRFYGIRANNKREALQKAELSPLVVLYVHTGNQQARDWYGNRTNNFVPVGSVVVRNGRPYQRMVLSLTQSPPKTPVST